MTFFQFLNTALLTYGPLWVLWKSNESHSLRLALTTVLVYGATQLAKMIFLATFAPALDDGAVFSAAQELIKTVAAAGDIAGLYFLFRANVRTGGDRNSRLLDISLGWVFAESVFQRFLPLWFASRLIEFSWLGLQIAVDSNIALLYRRAFVAASLAVTQAQPDAHTIVLAVALCCWPSVRSFLELGAGLGAFVGLALHLLVSALLFYATKTICSPSSPEAPAKKVR